MVQPMGPVSEVFSRVVPRFREERKKWEQMRKESPDTTCTVSHADCSTVLSRCASSTYRDRHTGTIHNFDDALPATTDMSCPCLDKAKRALEKANVQRVVQKAVSMFGRLPSEMAKRMTFETYLDNPDWRPGESKVAYKAWLYCKEYAADPKATPFLTLFGGYGAGKTHLAISIAQRADLQVVWANCTDLFSYLKTRFKIDFDDEVERIKTAQLLVLDDLGANRFTPWADEKLYEIVNHRHQERLPTVITTNFSPYGDNPIDGKLLSRMTDLDLGWVFQLDIQDNRRMMPRLEYRDWP